MRVFWIFKHFLLSEVLTQEGVSPSSRSLSSGVNGAPSHVSRQLPAVTSADGKPNVTVPQLSSSEESLLSSYHH